MESTEESWQSRSSIRVWSGKKEVSSLAVQVVSNANRGLCIHICNSPRMCLSFITSAYSALYGSTGYADSSLPTSTRLFLPHFKQVADERWEQSSVECRVQTSCGPPSSQTTWRHSERCHWRQKTLYGYIVVSARLMLTQVDWSMLPSYSRTSNLTAPVSVNVFSVSSMRTTVSR